MPQGMWNLPRPEIKPTSPALAGRFFATEPPETPPDSFLIKDNNAVFVQVRLSLQQFCKDKTRAQFCKVKMKTNRLQAQP